MPPFTSVLTCSLFGTGQTLPLNFSMTANRGKVLWDRRDISNNSIRHPTRLSIWALAMPSGHNVRNPIFRAAFQELSEPRTRSLNTSFCVPFDCSQFQQQFTVPVPRPWYPVPFWEIKNLELRTYLQNQNNFLPEAHTQRQSQNGNPTQPPGITPRPKFGVRIPPRVFRNTNKKASDLPFEE